MQLYNSRLYIRITPEGVDESGPLYERVAVIADDWLKERGLEQPIIMNN